MVPVFGMPDLKCFFYMRWRDRLWKRWLDAEREIIEAKDISDEDVRNIA